eukprot:15451893-Alexandrium_andersonii.AAC.1
MLLNANALGLMPTKRVQVGSKASDLDRKKLPWGALDLLIGRPWGFGLPDTERGQLTTMPL